MVLPTCSIAVPSRSIVSSVLNFCRESALQIPWAAGPPHLPRARRLMDVFEKELSEHISQENAKKMQKEEELEE